MMKTYEFLEFTEKLNKKIFNSPDGRKYYIYNMEYFFDHLAMDYFKVKKMNNVPISIKLDYMEWLISHEDKFGPVCKRLEKLGPFKAYLNGCEDGSLLYTIKGDGFINTLNIKYKPFISGKIHIHDIMRKENGEHYEWNYEV